MQIDINSDDPIHIREWVLLIGAVSHPNISTTVSISQFTYAERLEARGFIALQSTEPSDQFEGQDKYRFYKPTPEGIAFANFVRNIAPR